MHFVNTNLLLISILVIRVIILKIMIIISYMDTTYMLPLGLNVIKDQ